MKVRVSRASDWDCDGEIREFGSLDECLNTLRKETQVEKFVVSDNIYNNSDYDWSVEIYDDYIE